MATIAHYTAYKPRPFTREERETTTILFGGLTWKHERLVQGALHNLNYKAEPLPNISRADLDAGKEMIDVGACCPTIFTTGNLVNFLKSEVAARSQQEVVNKYVFLTAGACGPCRFGQYNRYHRLILDELGYQDVPVYAPDQDGNFYRELNIVNGNFPRLGWWGICGIDLLEKRLREVRPYEKNPGDAEKVYWEFVHKVCDAVTAKRFPDKELREAKEAFRRVPVNPIGGRPIIGVVGEIYVRSNRFSNENMVKKLEALGAEVRMPTIGEWIYYTNFCNKRKTWERGQIGDYFRTITSDFFQRRDEKKMENIINGDMRSGHEPPVKEIIERAAPYLHDSFEGEAVLSIGKSLEYIAHGCHGIVNAMPFTCMPGTVVNAILKRLRENNSNIPYLHMVYEGAEDTNANTRMEAFVHQAREFMERKDAASSVQPGKSNKGKEAHV